MFDQRVSREDPADAKDRQGMYGFIVLDGADAGVMPGDFHVSAGLSYVGPFEGRNQDILGFGVSWFHFSHEAGSGFTQDAETAVEAFYEIRLTPWLSVKPDLQYIHHPGGQDLDDAFAGTIRVEVTF